MSSASGIRAGKAFVLIEAVDRTGKVLGAIKNRIGRFAADMSSMGQTMALRAAAALTPVGFSLATYTKFDDAMRKVQARSQGTGAEMEALRTQAKELGRTTAFTASHIANLQARLAQFGMSRGDIQAATEPIMLLARAGGEGFDLGTDILQATDAVTQVLSAFSMASADSPMVADTLTVALNASKFSLEELATALQHAAPTAAAFNVPLNDTIATLAAFRELGYDSSIAGTAFRNMMLRTARSEGQEKFNKTLHETTGRMIDFTDASGNMIGPLQILMQLNDTLEGMGNAQAADMIAKLMELRATGPVLGGKESSDTIARIMTALEDAPGAARRIHDEMESGIGGGFRNLESAIEGVQIAVGEALDRMVTGISKVTTRYLGDITEWIQANAGFIAIAVLTVAAIGILGIALMALGQILIMTTTLFAAAAVATSAFATIANLVLTMTPAGLIITVATLGVLIGLVAAATAAYYLLGDAIAASFAKARQEATSTISQIANALRSGEIELAWELSLAQMKVVFFRFLKDIGEAYIILLRSLMDPTGMLESAQLDKLNPLLPRGGFKQAEDDMRIATTGLLEASEEELRVAKRRADMLELLEGPPSDIAPTDDSEWVNKLKAMGSLLGRTSPTSMLSGSTAPDVLEGVARGTMEAAKEIQKAKFEQWKDANKLLLEAIKEGNSIQEDILSKLDELAIGGV